MVSGQDHRRFLKTHSPLDGLPYYPECHYLVVFRDPRDMFFSMLKHRDNFTDEELAFASIPSGEDAFRQWLDRGFDPKNFDFQSLEWLCHFLQTYWHYRDLPNIHLFHYSDMKNDLPGHVRKVAGILEVELTEAQLDEMTAAASFEALRAKGDQFAPNAGLGAWKSEKDFFAVGTNAQWKGKLTPEDLAAFESRIRDFLSEEQIAWLVRG